MKCRNCKNNTLLDDGEQFSWCEIRKDNLDIDEERYCGAFSLATNADVIRAMTDEDLANFLNDIGECDRRCPAKIGDCIFSDSSCVAAWLDWLGKGAAK